MKNLLLLISLAIFIFTLVSCGGPKKDQKKMLQMFEEYTEIAVKAAKDKVLDEKEIEELNEISSKIDEFSQEMDKKYENDSESQKLMQDYMKEENNKTIIKEYTNALMLLWDCEGAENLE
ncbi:MAG TPA: hypothetical protein PKN32_07055 [Bacteroidales bacterium]|nr:hypothetical protein [Bacteroidales bacterium]